MVKKTSSKIKHKFNRTFLKKKPKVRRFWRSSEPLTDEDIERIRKEMDIVPKSPNNRSGYKKLL